MNWWLILGVIAYVLFVWPYVRKLMYEKCPEGEVSTKYMIIHSEYCEKCRKAIEDYVAQ